MIEVIDSYLIIREEMFKTFRANLQHTQKRMVHMNNKIKSEITFNWEIMFNLMLQPYR